MDSDDREPVEKLLFNTRQCASLLLSEGHGGAWFYPLGMLWNETAMARKRVNNRLATEAVLLQSAAMSIMSKQGGIHFTKTLRTLKNGG